MANPTAFQKKLATTAQQQYERYHLSRENQKPLSTQIQKYWVDLGFKFPGVGEAWSAVFVSWCVKEAGASKTQFRFAAMHADFVYRAIKNTNSGSGVFFGHPVDSYVPKLGDILQNNQPGRSYDFSYASLHASYHSHSAIVMEVGSDNKGQYLRTIGGNESDSVGLKEVRLDSTGRVKNPDGLYIAVIETTL